MKKINIIYWISTGLFAFLMGGSAIPNILMAPESVQGFSELGLPAHLIPFLGWAKLAGVVGILVPGFPRVREWAYAGLMIDLIGAIYLIAMSGKPAYIWGSMFVGPLIGYISYAYAHKRQQASTKSVFKTDAGLG